MVTKLHSKRVEKMSKHTPNELRRRKYTPQTSGVDVKTQHLDIGNLQSYWTTKSLCKLTVVLDYYEPMETYSRIGLLRSYGNLQSYWTTTKLRKLTVVLNYKKLMKLTVVLYFTQLTKG